MATFDDSNENFRLAADFVMQTNKSVFLTGKAGTGKTTFLKYIRENCGKQTVVLAPTGVAAINAGGVTIHSFFQLPFGLFTGTALPIQDGNPSSSAAPVSKHALLSKLRFNREKKELLHSLELIIIDEVSMVRSDAIDAIDTILRAFGGAPGLPFGGAQMLFIGDLHQLPPVVKEEEWQLLRQIYKSPYFFDSRVLQTEQPLYVELDKIYRQSEQHFIEVLNQVRNNCLNEEGLKLLESRFLPNFNPPKEEGFISLTTHNSRADGTNEYELNRLMGDLFSFPALIKDEFPEKLFPCDANLHLKIGAQVMFIKNDIEKERRYYNGKIGIISAIDASEASIFVQCKNESKPIRVNIEVWRNIRYSLNKEKQELEEETIGSFSQYPLRLAWAITIHKSQGLTFEKAIIDAGSAFAPGQVYVALSRCRSLEGLVLSSKLHAGIVFTDERINKFSSLKTDATSLQPQLKTAMHAYEASLITGLFEFEAIVSAIRELAALLHSEPASVEGDVLQLITSLEGDATNLSETAARFAPALDGYLQEETIPSANPAFIERLKQAAGWFAGQIRKQILEPLSNMPVAFANKTKSTLYLELSTRVGKLCNPLHECFVVCASGFTMQAFLKARSRARISQLTAPAYSSSAEKERNPNPNIKLYSQLKVLRDDLATVAQLEGVQVMNLRTLDELARYLPQNRKELEKINGMGPFKISKYGEPVLKLIQVYCSENGKASRIGDKNKMLIAGEGSYKKDTRLESYQLYKQGKGIIEIAVHRKLAPGTIENHLAHFVLSGELAITDLLGKQKLDLIIPVVKEIGGEFTSPIKERLGDSASHGEIRLVMNWLSLEQVTATV